MAAVSAADRVYQARMVRQDSMRFATEFWEISDLLPYLKLFIERISNARVGTSSGGLELGLAIRRMVAEKCLERWGMLLEEENCLRRLSEALHFLHVTLHAAGDIITSEARTAAMLALQEIEFMRLHGST